MRSRLVRPPHMPRARRGPGRAPGRPPRAPGRPHRRPWRQQSAGRAMVHPVLGVVALGRRRAPPTASEGCRAAGARVEDRSVTDLRAKFREEAAAALHPRRSLDLLARARAEAGRSPLHRQGVSAPFLRRGRARSGEGDRPPVLVGLPRPVEVHDWAALSHATASFRGRH
jgi:hypothetical protein